MRAVQDRLRECLMVDATSSTGLRWIKAPCNRVKVDSEAFTAVNAGGYYNGGCSGKILLAHRVVWFLVHNEWPRCIVHINRVKTDNRIENLRAVNSSENPQNMFGLGYAIVQRKGRTKYHMQCTVQGVKHSRMFSTADAARAAYLRLKVKAKYL